MTLTNDMRKFWIDHFSSTEHSLDETFISLKPSDCLTLLKKIGVSEVEGTIFESAENRVFGFKDVVIKFYRPGRWSFDALQEELQFLKDLNDANVSVVRPIGNIGTWNGIHYLAYEAIQKPFELTPETLDKNSIRKLAHLMAKIHEVGSKRDAPSRPQFDPKGSCLGCLEVIFKAGFIPMDLQNHYKEVVEQIIEKITLFGDIPVQRIHGDSYSGNVIWHKDDPIFMDFDDFQMGPVDLDIGLLSSPWRLNTLSQNMDRSERRIIQHELVLNYYNEIRPAVDTSKTLYPLLSACRDIQFDAWFSSRWNEQGFAEKYSGNDIHSSSWWQESIEGLEQLLTS